MNDIAKTDESKSKNFELEASVEIILDVMLLAIIREHYLDDKILKDEWTRLRTAKKALFGIKPSRGNPADNDIPELLYMAKAYIEQRGNPDYDADYNLVWQNEDEEYSSETQLATDAVEWRKNSDPSCKYHNENEKIRNLQQKFHGNIDDWLKIAFNQDGLAQDVFTFKLTQLEELFAPLGIKIVNPRNAMRDSNSWN